MTEIKKVPWQCKWFGHDWTTYVGFPWRRQCERCGLKQKERDGGLPVRWVNEPLIEEEQK